MQRPVDLDQVLNEVDAYLAEAANKRHTRSANRRLARALAGVSDYITATAPETTLTSVPVAESRDTPTKHDDFWSLVSGRHLVVQDVQSLHFALEERRFSWKDVTSLKSFANRLSQFWHSGPSQSRKLILLAPTAPTAASKITLPKGVMRCTVGRGNTQDDVSCVLDYLRKHKGLSPKSLIWATCDPLPSHSCSGPLQTLAQLDSRHLVKALTDHFLVEDLINGKKIRPNCITGKHIIVCGTSLLRVASARVARSCTPEHRPLMLRLSGLSQLLNLASPNFAVDLFYVVGPWEQVGKRPVPKGVKLIYGDVDEVRRKLVGVAKESEILTFASSGESSSSHVPPEVLWSLIGKNPDRWMRHVEQKAVIGDQQGVIDKSENSIGGYEDTAASK